MHTQTNEANFINKAKISFILLMVISAIFILTTDASAAMDKYYFAPVADSYVVASQPDTNRGRNSNLNTVGNPSERATYMRFDIQDLNGYSVTEAFLWVYVNNGQPTSGFDVRTVSDNSWGEMTITYKNAPATGNVIGSSGSVTPGSWVAVDITSSVTGEGELSLALTSNIAEYTSYASNESVETAPVIILKTDDPNPWPPPCIPRCGPDAN